MRPLILAAFCLASLADTPMVAESSILGRKVENFTLKDFRGESRSLDDLRDKPLVVIAALGTECPLAKLYAPRLAALAEEFEPWGVAFLGLDANRQDSLTEIAAYARTHKLKFPILKDLGNQITDRLGAERTPEVVVLDANRVVQYRGRIDDQYGIGTARKSPTREDLRLALEELLAGKAVSVAETQSVGCLIGRVRQPSTDSDVTYSNQIARILQDRCVECHRPGEIGPFALTDYEEVVGWADMIAEVVRDERMPPWHADPHYGKFSNDRRLSDREKQLIEAWVAAGAPEGDRAQLPEPRQFTVGWQLPREPDQIIAMRDEPFSVPADGEVRYQYFAVKTDFPEDRWVRASEVVPGNRAVVHHVLVLLRTDGQLHGRGTQYIGAYVPGLRAEPLPKGMAKRIPKGAELVFQVHYTPIGTPQQDRTRIGLIFADPREVTHEVTTVATAQRNLSIPPGDDRYRVVSQPRTINKDVLLLSLAPHMHLRGKSFHYEAVFPKNRRDVLLDVPRYDFNWQTTYRLKEPLPLPAGTRIESEARFDNSAENLANPDPTATVHWGDQTWEEMMIGYFDIAMPLASPGQPRADMLFITDETNPRQVAERMMRQLDRDKDGRLSRAEIPEKQRIYFALLDTDLDESLSLEELSAGLKQLAGRAGQ